MSQAIRNSIYSRLTASTGDGTLYADVGGRFYESQQHQTAEYPHVVYSVTDNPVEQFFGGKHSQTCEVEFVIRGSLGTEQTSGGSPDAQAVGAMEAKLFTLMEGVSMTCTGFDRAFCYARTRGVPTWNADLGSHESTSTYVVVATSA